MKIFKPLIITIGSILIILILLATIAPPIAKNYLIKHSKELIGRQVYLKGLYCNLFTGYTRITDFQLMEENDRDIFAAFDTLIVDISLLPLLHNELKINRIDLVNPDIRLLQNQEKFNFDDLLGTSSNTSTVSDSITQPISADIHPNPKPLPQSATSNPSDTLMPTNSMSVAIYNIMIREGHIFYKDLARNSVWEIEDFGLQIPGIYFNGKNTDVGIELAFNEGGHLKTAIQYNLEAGNYNLNLELEKFPIHNLRPYLTDFLNIQALQGNFSTQLNLKGNALHITDMTLNGSLQLDTFGLYDLQSQPVLLSDRLQIDIREINPEKQIFHFSNIELNGLKSTFEIDPSGNTMSRLLKENPVDTLTVPVEKTDPEISIETDSTFIPDLKIEKFRVNQAQLSFLDKTLHQPFLFTLENIQVTADQITLDGKNAFKINSSLKNGGKINLAWDGQLNDISNQNLYLGIKNLDLKDFTPYSLQYFGYPLKNGILSFNSVNNVRENMLDGRNRLVISKCEVASKQKAPKPEYNLPLKTALYLIKDVNDQIKMDLPVSGNITSPEFSYKKIIIKTLTNLLVKVAVSPIHFLAGSMGFSPDKLQSIPFTAVQNDFTPEQLVQINQLAEIVKTKPEMTLTLEQYVNLLEYREASAMRHAKKKFYLSQHPEKNESTLLPIDYSKIFEIDTYDENFKNYINSIIPENLKSAPWTQQIQALSDSLQQSEEIRQLCNRRNQLLANYLIRQGINEKNVEITTISEEKLTGYKGKNLYKVNLVFKEDEPIETENVQE